MTLNQNAFRDQNAFETLSEQLMQVENFPCWDFETLKYDQRKLYTRSIFKLQMMKELQKYNNKDSKDHESVNAF